MPTMTERRTHADQRRAEVERLTAAGRTRAEIARALAITPTRVGQIIQEQRDLALGRPRHHARTTPAPIRPYRPIDEAAPRPAWSYPDAITLAIVRQARAEIITT